jgi:hypothetical protein
LLGGVLFGGRLFGGRLFGGRLFGGRSLRGPALGGLLLGGLLLGCPLYDEDCSDGSGCAVGFQCDLYSQRCVASVVAPSCVRPEQCAAAETCTPDFVCRPGSCDFYGCVGGFACGIVDGAHACVPLGQGDAGAEAMAAPGPADAAASSDASTQIPADASVPDAALGDAAADGGT